MDTRLVWDRTGLNLWRGSGRKFDGNKAILGYFFLMILRWMFDATEKVLRYNWLGNGLGWGWGAAGYI